MSTVNVAALKESSLAFWEARKPRERTALVVGAIVVFATLLYALALAPLIEGRQQLQQVLPSLRQQAAELQGLAQTAAQFGDTGAASAPAPTRDAVEASLRDKGIKAQSVMVEGGLVRVQLTGASFSALIDWLDVAQKTGRLAVADASIVAQPAPDSVNATVTLRQRTGTSE